MLGWLDLAGVGGSRVTCVCVRCTVWSGPARWRGMTRTSQKRGQPEPGVNDARPRVAKHGIQPRISFNRPVRRIFYMRGLIPCAFMHIGELRGAPQRGACIEQHGNTTTGKRMLTFWGHREAMRQRWRMVRMHNQVSSNGCIRFVYQPFWICVWLGGKIRPGPGSPYHLHHPPH